MKVSRAHNMAKEAARKQVKNLLPHLLKEMGSNVNNPKQAWRGDTLDFSFYTMGYDIRGQLVINDTAVTIDVGIPFLAKLFEGKVRSTVEQRLREYFP